LQYFWIFLSSPLQGTWHHKNPTCDKTWQSSSKIQNSNSKLQAHSGNGDV
jgi:hypothetical protein